MNYSFTSPFHIFTYQGKITHCCSSAGIIHHLRPNGNESERFSSLLELNAAYSVWGVKYISFIIAHLYRCYGCCFTAKITNNHHSLWSKEIKVFRWPLAHIFNFISAKNITTILFFLELTKQTCVLRFLIGIRSNIKRASKCTLLVISLSAVPLQQNCFAALIACSNVLRMETLSLL